MKIKMYLIFVVSLIFIAYAFFEYQNNSDKELIRKSFELKAKETFNEKDDLFEGYLNKFGNVLLSIEDNRYFHSYISQKNDEKYVKELFLSYMKSMPEIYQLRYIDKNGNEKIRVDKNKDKTYTIIEKNKLQNKKHRYYFKDTLAKNSKEIWYSNMDLNMEHNKIVKPIQPTLRVGIPVISSGIKKGILIMNINIDYFLAKLVKSSNYNIYVFDKDGHFVKDSNNKYSWSKYLEKNKTLFNSFDIQKTKDKKIKLLKDTYFIKNTSFKNNDNLMLLIELKNSDIDNEIEAKRQNRTFILVVAILLIISIAYIAYSRKYTSLLEKHNKKMDGERKKIRNILDSQNSIVLLTNGKSIVDGNKRFLDFFAFDSIEEFRLKHDSICDYFEDDGKHDYLQKEIDGKNWVFYVLLNPNKTHKAKITDKDGKTHIFIVNIKEYDAKNNVEIITFSDVTELEQFKNSLEDRVLEKTEELRTLNQGLEISIKKEVEKNREKEKQLFEREKMAQMGEMIGNIAHQWRQPLSTISTSASGLLVQDELGILDSDMLHSNLDVIVKASEFLSDTIDDFRDFIKEDKEYKEFNVKDTVEQIIKITYDSYLHNFIRLESELIDVNIHSIPGELSQVILNILNNAKDILVKNKNENRIISLKMAKTQDSVIISIEDNAGGVPEEILPKIFDLYFTTKHQSAGTGVGLYMSHKIITKNLNGNLSVKNTDLGAKFIIDLPLS